MIYTLKEIQDNVNEDFYIHRNPFDGKDCLGLGTRLSEMLKQEFPEIIYEPEAKTMFYNGGEFCLVFRVCETYEEMKEFINSINFLFKLDL